jgi:hypothetical protein
MTTTLHPLDPADRGALLAIARAAIGARLGVAPAPTLPGAGRLATEARGIFATLRAGDRLRGHVGTLAPQGALAPAAARIAVTAATEDPRFHPIEAAEWPALHVALAVVGPLSPLSGPAALRPGKDGVVVTSGWHRGALLPGLAVESGWDAQTFLVHACLKAGLPADAWEDPATTVQTFEAEEFGE